MKKLLIVALSLVCVASTSRGEAVKSLRLILPPQPPPLVENIGRVFVRQVQSRCDAKVVTQGDAPLAVELTIEPGIGDEGFKIADGANGTIRIVGNDARGVLYGVGKFLHTSAYDSRGFTPSTWRGVSVPKMPHRMMYLASHFQNYYQVAPIEEVARYVEDLSLWGVNGFVVWFGMEEFNGINDPKAQAMLERLRALLKTAKDIGLDTGAGCVGNDGYRNSPSELRATMVPFNQGVELCPNKPGVLELELQFCQEKFEAFKSVGLDYWFIVPYDNGGCGCAKCIPWGINGFLKVAEPEARAFRRAFPNGKVVMSTWYFDHPQLYSGEWVGLTEKFKARKPDWVDCIMADNFEAYPRYPLDQGVPGGLPLLNFPDISMWGQNPWGGYGANPHPGRLQQRWDETRKHLAGGMPYSEGIYEDLNKVICAQFYWEPDRSALETVKEYAAFEFSPEVADDVTSVVRIFEKNHLRDKVGESAVTACQLVERANAKLTPQARSSWRWRLFCIRAAIDQEIYRNSSGQGRNEVFQKACDELTKISHAENVWSVLRPAPIPAVNVKGPGLPDGHAKAVAASATADPPSIAVIRPDLQTGFTIAGWNHDRYADLPSLDAHKSITVADLKGPGIIRHIHFTRHILQPKELVSRGVVLQVWFDDAEEPAVQCPLADFFGDGCNGEVADFSTPLIECVPLSYNAYIPMPFKSRARVVLRNDTDVDVKNYSHVEWENLPEWNDKLGYFHATFNRKCFQLTKDTNEILFRVEGTGHLIGRQYSIVSDEPLFAGLAYVTEGNNEVDIDGQLRKLDYLGTEDSFNFSWGFPRPFAGLRSGMTLIKCDMPSKLSIYRFHDHQPIRFNKSLTWHINWDQERELYDGWDKPSQEEKAPLGSKWSAALSRGGCWVDFATVHYWYQSVPGGYRHTPLPTVADRAKVMLRPAREPSPKTP